jgi:membrane protease YdiL (CAAX protease family)
MPTFIRTNAQFILMFTILSIGAVLGSQYLQHQNIPLIQSVGILSAFLIEAAMFLAAGSTQVRDRLTTWIPWHLALTLTLQTTLTWILAGGREIYFMAAVTAIAALIAFWYVEFPRLDIPLIVIFGVLALGKFSTVLYPIPWANAPTAYVGELAWLRTFLFAVLIFRRPTTIDFRFLPTRQESLDGLKWFAFLIPAVLVVGFLIGFAKLRELPADPAKFALTIAGTFLGHYLFVALREEFLFRGMILPKLQREFGGGVGLVVNAVIFGAVHLPFGQFPNWRFALVAAVAGWFYGRAYNESGSIQSSMLTHALTNVVARVFLAT